MDNHLLNHIFRRTRLHNRFFAIVSVSLMVALTVTPVKAYDFAGVVVHVTTISPVGFPGNVEFQGDTAPSACPANLFFYFPGGSDEATQQANAKAILATVMTAQLTGRSVTIYGINPTSTFAYCQAQWIVLNNS